jgi:hypothetical protein
VVPPRRPPWPQPQKTVRLSFHLGKVRRGPLPTGRPKAPPRASREPRRGSRWSSRWGTERTVANLQPFSVEQGYLPPIPMRARSAGSGGIARRNACELSRAIRLGGSGGRCSIQMSYAPERRTIHSPRPADAQGQRRPSHAVAAAAFIERACSYSDVTRSLAGSTQTGLPS